MGGVCSNSRDVVIAEKCLRNVAIDKANLVDFESASRVKKLLLLGAGESGKSTVFKQMIDLYGNGFTDQQKKEYLSVIHSNLLIAAKALAIHSKQFVEDGLGDCLVSEENRKRQQFFIDLPLDSVMTTDLASALKSFWEDPGIQVTWALRSKFQILDGTEYLMSHIDDYTTHGYIPTKQDILNTRVRTSGVVSAEFKIDDLLFEVFDVGGQRNERKKWIHCFQSVTAIIFVAAVSEYDQVLFEDNATNRIVEAINLFDQVVNSKYFGETSIILFLNKKDLFIEKLKTVPLKVAFPDYEGDNSYESAWKFIAAKFGATRKDSSRQIYAHVTCATDDTNVHRVFAAVKDTVVRKSLLKSGMI